MTKSIITNHLKPVFKWVGGKRLEIKNFAEYLPEYVTAGEKYTYVEPFVGGGALYWYLNNTTGKNIINDIEPDVTNFYEQMKIQDINFLETIAYMESLFTTGSHDDRMKLYYDLRNLDRSEGGVNSLCASERASRFYILNQLAFSGMRRFNSKGQFNVPFGHYKSFDASLVTSPRHVKLLKKTKVMTGDYRKALVGTDKPNTFIFLDPSIHSDQATEEGFDKIEQEKLRNKLRTFKQAQWMLIVDDTPLSRRLYKDFVINEYVVDYGDSGNKRAVTQVQRLVIRNYQ